MPTCRPKLFWPSFLLSATGSRRSSTRHEAEVVSARRVRPGETIVVPFATMVTCCNAHVLRLYRYLPRRVHPTSSLGSLHVLALLGTIAVAHRQLRVFRKTPVAAARMPESCSDMKRWCWRKYCTTPWSKSTRRRACWRKGGPRQQQGDTEGRFDHAETVELAERTALSCDWLAFPSYRWACSIVDYLVRSEQCNTIIHSPTFSPTTGDRRYVLPKDGTTVPSTAPVRR